MSNFSDFEFFFLVHDPNLYIELNFPNFHLVFSNPPNRKISSNHFVLAKNSKNSGDTLSHPDTISFIKNTSGQKNVCIIPFKPSAKIDFICRKHSWLVASNDSKINRSLEDKINFYYLCQKYNLPSIPSFVDYFTKDNFIKAQNLFSQPELVIQTSFGWAGNSTHHLDSWQNSQKLNIPSSRKVKFTPYFKNCYTFLNNCCIYKSELFQSPPAIQLTNLGLSLNPFSTVGRHWPSCLSKNQIASIREITKNFSHILTKLNYHGYFGIDFLLHENKIYILECNPRLTASFSFYHHLEDSRHITSLFLLHLAEFCQIDLEINRDPKILENIRGYQATPRTPQGKIIEKIESDNPLINSLDQYATICQKLN